MELSLNLIVALIIGFAVGCLVTTIISIIFYSIQQRKLERREQNRHSVINSIGKLCAHIENAYSANKIGTMNDNTLRDVLLAKNEEINTALRANIDILDPFYVKNIERFIDDQNTFLQKGKEAQPKEIKTQPPQKLPKDIFPPKDKLPDLPDVKEKKDQPMKPDLQLDKTITETPVPKKVTKEEKPAIIEKVPKVTKDETFELPEFPPKEVKEVEEKKVEKKEKPDKKPVKKPIEEEKIEKIEKVEKIKKVKKPEEVEKSKKLEKVDKAEKTVKIPEPIVKPKDAKKEESPAVKDIDDKKDKKDIPDLKTSFESGVTARIPVESIKMYQEPPKPEPQEEIPELPSSSFDAEITQIFPEKSQIPEESSKTDESEFVLDMSNDSTAKKPVLDLDAAQFEDTFSSPSPDQVEDRPIKGAPVFDSSFDVEATQIYNVEDLLKKTDSEEATTGKEEKPQATIFPPKESSDNLFTHPSSPDSSEEDETFEVNIPKNAPQKKSPPKKKSGDSDSLITGNDVMDQMDNFFGFDNE